MTMITEATPITTPMRVRMERILFPHSDCSASRKASISGMILLSVPERPGAGCPPGRDSYPADAEFSVHRFAPTRQFQCTQSSAFEASVAGTTGIGAAGYVTVEFARYCMDARPPLQAAAVQPHPAVSVPG